MKTFVILAAVMAVAVANPLPLVQLIVNVDAPNSDSPPVDNVIVPPANEDPVPRPPPVLPIFPKPIIVRPPVFPIIPGPGWMPESNPPVVVPEPAELPEPVLPVPGPETAVLPEPVLPAPAPEPELEPVIPELCPEGPILPNPDAPTVIKNCGFGSSTA